MITTNFTGRPGCVFQGWHLPLRLILLTAQRERAYYPIIPSFICAELGHKRQIIFAKLTMGEQGFVLQQSGSGLQVASFLNVTFRAVRDQKDQRKIIGSTGLGGRAGVGTVHIPVKTALKHLNSYLLKELKDLCNN